MDNIRKHTNHNLKVIVVTDGERIVGLVAGADGGMGVPNR
ncbi:hypothetical protein ACNKHW_10705 [Shigella flexneri]